MRNYTILAAYLIDGTQITGVPEYNAQTWGNYNSKFPQEAASKAYSNLLQFIKKYKNPWFRDVDDNAPIIMVLFDKSDVQKPYIYYAYREVASQSVRGSRIVYSKDGRSRRYNWKNRVIPMREGETPDEAIVRYQERRHIAQTRYNSLKNLGLDEVS